MKAYIGILILAGVYHSRHEATRDLWDDKTRWAIFRATMSHYRYSQISANIHFDDRLTCPGRFRDDKLAAFHILWEKWVACFPLLFSPGVDVRVDEQLVAFKGCCWFRRYMLNKPAKYGIKIWVTRAAVTSYAWKVQIYTGGKKNHTPHPVVPRQLCSNWQKGSKDTLSYGTTLRNSSWQSNSSEGRGRKKNWLWLAQSQETNQSYDRFVSLQQRKTLSSVFAFTKMTMAESYVPSWGENAFKHKAQAVMGKIWSLQQSCATIGAKAA